MSTFIKPIVFGLGLVAAVALSAQAQTTTVTPGPSVATLPPTDAGPRVSSHNFVHGDRLQAVAPSSAYPGPAPGAGTGQMPPRYEKSADWDSNPMNKPYDQGKSPR